MPSPEVQIHRKAYAYSTPVRVVKVGGSLLDWPPLPRSLCAWLAEQPAAVNVLICGGGPFTDAIREIDRKFSLGEESAHWLCIDALAVSARLLAQLLRDTPLIESLDQLAAAPDGASVIVDPRRFLIEIEPRSPGSVLPHAWSATTDSIAARIAELLSADELVLLKSTNPPELATAADLAAAGFVDLHFPQAAGAIARWRCVNLRAQGD